MSSVLIELDKIDYEPKYYPRANGEADWMTIHRYTDALLADKQCEFSPITVVKATGKDRPFLLIDGLHRIGAYTRAGRERIPAVIERLPQSRWLARSVELNVCHGRTLDTGDKAWICKRLEEDGWDKQSVAQLLKMRVESLEKIVVTHCAKLTIKSAELIKPGRSNRQIGKEHFGFLKAPVTGANGTQFQQEALASQNSLSSRTVVNVLDSVIAVVKSGCIDMSNDEMASRVQALKELLKDIN